VRLLISFKNGEQSHACSKYEHAASASLGYSSDGNRLILMAYVCNETLSQQ